MEPFHEHIRIWQKINQNVDNRSRINAAPMIGCCCDTLSPAVFF
jgi:hypothetical protein